MTDFNKFSSKDLKYFIKQHRKGQAKQYLLGGCRKCDLVKMAQSLEGGVRDKKKIENRDELKSRYIYCGVEEKLPPGYKDFGTFDECYKKGQVKRYGRYKFDSIQYNNATGKLNKPRQKKKEKDSLLMELVKNRGLLSRYDRELKELRNVVEFRRDNATIEETLKKRQEVVAKIKSIANQIEALEEKQNVEEVEQIKPVKQIKKTNKNISQVQEIKEQSIPVTEQKYGLKVNKKTNQIRFSFETYFDTIEDKLSKYEDYSGPWTKQDYNNLKISKLKDILNDAKKAEQNIANTKDRNLIKIKKFFDSNNNIKTSSNLIKILIDMI